MKILYIDTETTGLDDETCAIWQLSGIVEIDNKEVETFNIFMKPNPDQNINLGALEATKSSFDLINKGISQFEGYNQFIYILDKYINKYDTNDKFFMVGYNNHSFDSNFIRKFMKMHGNTYYGSYFWHPGIDVMLIAAYAAMKDRQNLENFKLTTVAKSLGINVIEEKLHDALYDINLTKEIFKLIQQEYK